MCACSGSSRTKASRRIERRLEDGHGGSPSVGRSQSTGRRSEEHHDLHGQLELGEALGEHRNGQERSSTRRASGSLGLLPARTLVGMGELWRDRATAGSGLFHDEHVPPGLRQARRDL